MYTLKEPEKHIDIPENAQWLSGEGAGSWFSIVLVNNNFQITRYSPDGDVECRSIFETESSIFNIRLPFQFVHLSHCKEVNISQKDIVHTFKVQL